MYKCPYNQNATDNVEQYNLAFCILCNKTVETFVGGHHIDSVVLADLQDNALI